MGAKAAIMPHKKTKPQASINFFAQITRHLNEKGKMNLRLFISFEFYVKKRKSLLFAIPTHKLKHFS